MDSAALLRDVDYCPAVVPAIYGLEQLDGNGVIAELGDAHEGGGCSLSDVQHAAVLLL